MLPTHHVPSHCFYTLVDLVRSLDTCADLETRKKDVRADSISMRLARGEPAWDMLSLKAAITNAQPGELQGVLSSTLAVIPPRPFNDLCQYALGWPGFGRLSY